MLENDLTLAAMAEALAKSTDYRVLRRLVPRETFSPSIGLITKTGTRRGLREDETTIEDRSSRRMRTLVTQMAPSRPVR